MISNKGFFTHLDVSCQITPHSSTKTEFLNDNMLVSGLEKRVCFPYVRSFYSFPSVFSWDKKKRKLTALRKHEFLSLKPLYLIRINVIIIKDALNNSPSDKTQTKPNICVSLTREGVSTYPSTYWKKRLKKYRQTKTDRSEYLVCFKGLWRKTFLQDYEEG